MRKRSFLSLLMAIIVLAGCSQPPQPSNKILLWHWMTDRHETFQQLATQYQQQTGVMVDVQLFAPSEQYSQKIIAAAQANILPDIYGVLDKKSVVADFIKAGLVADLTEAMQADGAKWKDSLFEKALADKRFDEGNMHGVKAGIYGVPIDVTNQQMIYNKKLFSKAGITSAPQTWEEFIKDAQALKKAGITPFVAGWGELWLLDCFASNYAFNVMGEEKVFATYEGKVKYTDPDWVRVLSLFAQLRDLGALMDGIVTKGNKFAEQDFALEKAAMTFNGSWSVNVYYKMNPNLEYGVFPPPAINAAHPLKIWGSAGSTFVVNASSANKDKAIAFLKWLTAKEQQAVLAKETRNLPSNKEELSGVSEVMAAFAKGMEVSTHPNVWPRNEDPTVSEVFDKGIQDIIIGQRTPQQVAQEVERVKEQQMAKEKH